MTRDDIFVSTQWLAERLEAPDIVVLDGSFYLPAQGRDANAEYAERRIPGAVRFDIDVVKDPASELPHMLPRPDAFAAQVGAMGLATACASSSMTGSACSRRRACAGPSRPSARRTS